MVDKAKTNGGFIDQKLFKTDTSMQVLDGYITTFAHFSSLTVIMF